MNAALRAGRCLVTARDIYDYCMATNTAVDIPWIAANLGQVIKAVQAWRAQGAGEVR